MQTPLALYEKAGGVLALQLHLLDLGHETAAVGGQESCYDAEHGVTEAADIQDVAMIRGLNGVYGPVLGPTSDRAAESGFRPAIPAPGELEVLA